VIGLGLDEPLELSPRFPVFAFRLGHQGMVQTMVDERVAQEHPALGAELIGGGGFAAASLASHG
jgi:alpha-galactosidase/6-phospho-beta-glucosidase family protein